MKPKKKIYDSIHGFIYFSEWECQLIDSFAFQRLHYIRQLGSAYLVYPGAVHTRFEHSFGVMECASQIFDKLREKNTLFEEIGDLDYWRRVLRLAALTHDLGHLPFSHSAEQALLGEGGHEKWTLAIIRSPTFQPLWDAIKKAYPSHDPINTIIKISLGQEKLKTIGEGSLTFSTMETLLSEIITGDFFGADRIDYLLRDAKYTGLSYGVFDYHQLIEMLCILPDKEKGEWGLGIEENGIESCEALLLARHFMFRRIYEYPSVKAYAFHLIRFMQEIYQQSDFQRDLDHYLHFTDNEVLSKLNLAAKDSHHLAHDDAKAFFLRQKRFRAIPLTKETTEEKLIAYKKENNIPNQSISWEFTPQREEKIGLNFLILLKNDLIVPANSLSDLVIPSPPSGWLFLSPELSF